MNEKNSPDREARIKTMSVLFDLLSAAFAGIGLFMAWNSHGTDIFIYYTNNSNILAFFACIFHALLTVTEMISGKETLHIFAKMLKYSAALCVGVTFAVVLFVLAPTSGENGYYYSFFVGEMLYLHLLCPIFTMLSFVLFDKKPRLSSSSMHIAMIPTFIYAAVSVVLNILKVWEGPYFFLLIHKNPLHMTILWAVVVFGLAYFIAFLLFMFNGNRFRAIGSTIKFILGGG